MCTWAPEQQADVHLSINPDWKTRQPVTEESTAPVRAKPFDKNAWCWSLKIYICNCSPAMKWRRQGHPQKMATKTTRKVVILAITSSSFPEVCSPLLVVCFRWDAHTLGGGRPPTWGGACQEQEGQPATTPPPLQTWPESKTWSLNLKVNLGSQEGKVDNDKEQDLLEPSFPSVILKSLNPRQPRHPLLHSHVHPGEGNTLICICGCSRIQNISCRMAFLHLMDAQVQIQTPKKTNKNTMCSFLGLGNTMISRTNMKFKFRDQVSGSEIVLRVQR